MESQANSTTLGIIPLQPQHGQLRIASAHIMLSAYGAASPDEAGTYFLAHTFDGRCAASPAAGPWGFGLFVDLGVHSSKR